VGKLDKEVLPLHLPIPHDSQFLITKEKDLPDNASDEEIAAHCFLYIWVSFFSSKVFEEEVTDGLHSCLTRKDACSRKEKRV